MSYRTLGDANEGAELCEGRDWVKPPEGNEKTEVENLLKPKHVSKILSCSLAYVYKAAESGLLPCVRVPSIATGKRQKSLVRFTLKDVEDFIERHRLNNVI